MTSRLSVEEFDKRSIANDKNAWEKAALSTSTKTQQQNTNITSIPEDKGQ